MDFPGPVSLVHAGLDVWPFDATNAEHREFMIDDEFRLARRLGVEYFVVPPDYRVRKPGMSDADIRNPNITLPFVRFPLWHSCPRCGRMKQAGYADNAAPECDGPMSMGQRQGEGHKRTRMTQVRFVAACAAGHLQDFPWLEWVYQSQTPDFDPTTMWLRLRNKGSASLGGVEVSVERRDAGGKLLVVVKRRSLAGAFGGDPGSGEPSALTKVYGPCRGYNPSLGIPSEGRPAQGCDRHLFASLRGGTNLYIARVASAIFVPPDLAADVPEDVARFLELDEAASRLRPLLESSEGGKITPKGARSVVKELASELASTIDLQVLADAANRSIIPTYFLRPPVVKGALDQLRQIEPARSFEDIVGEVRELHFPDWEIPAKDLAAYVEDYFRSESGGRTATEDLAAGTESDFRHQEFRALRTDIDEGRPRRNLRVGSCPIRSYGPIVRDHFDRVSLVHKLRETRAFCGFARFYSDDRVGMSPQTWSLIASEKKKWLPAIEVRGEGLFFEFREAALLEWEQSLLAQTDRYARMNESLRDLRAKRKQDLRVTTPRFVLLHTFAHVMINQLVYECGYSSAALRERIYYGTGDTSMSGVLIYTAAGDSEGTLGGLVAMGEPGRLERVIAQAVDRAKWCSSDPVCSESQGQGPGNCNLAACHACALLPETSCEEQNRLLDRAALVGTPEAPELAYFKV